MSLLFNVDVVLQLVLQLQQENETICLNETRWRNSNDLARRRWNKGADADVKRIWLVIVLFGLPALKILQHDAINTRCARGTITIVVDVPKDKLRMLARHRYRTTYETTEKEYSLHIWLLLLLNVQHSSCTIISLLVCSATSNVLTTSELKVVARPAVVPVVVGILLLVILSAFCSLLLEL